MALNSTTIYVGAQALLNDQGVALYTTATLQPLLQIALRDLEARIVLEDGPWLNTVTATTAYVSGTAWPGTLPVDIVYPMYLEERATGSTLESDWIRMTFKDELPDEQTQTELNYWTWRNEAILFLGATGLRDVRMFYKRLVVTTPTTGVISGILQFAENYLEYHLAELAAATIGQNADIAQALGQYADMKMDELLAIISKHNQKVPIRRKRYGRKFGRIGSGLS